MSNQFDDLSPEAESAMQMALHVLEGDGDRSQSPVRETQRIQPQTNQFDGRPTALQMAVELMDQIKVIHIANRDSIPISEEYVLVMEGLSTYVFEHARGASFVVDNSRYNRDRDRHYRDALDSAVALAKAKGLPGVYVLD